MTLRQVVVGVTAAKTNRSSRQAEFGSPAKPAQRRGGRRFGFLCGALAPTALTASSAANASHTSGADIRPPACGGPFLAIRTNDMDSPAAPQAAARRRPSSTASYFLFCRPTYWSPAARFCCCENRAGSSRRITPREDSAAALILRRLRFPLYASVASF